VKWRAISLLWRGFKTNFPIKGIQNSPIRFLSQLNALFVISCALLNKTGALLAELGALFYSKGYLPLKRPKGEKIVPWPGFQSPHIYKFLRVV
jgi:hypothetical protein